MTRPAELRQMNDDELAHHLRETQEEVFHLRFQLAMGKQDNSARLGHVRREVARVLTLQRQRQDGKGHAAPARPRDRAAKVAPETAARRRPLRRRPAEAGDQSEEAR